LTVLLVPLAREHLEAMAALIEDPDVLRFTRVPDPPPPGFVEGWFARYEKGRVDGTREGFAIVDEANRFLGLALAPTIDRQARSVELGYVIAPEARGRGVATEALRRLTDWGFSELGVLRAELLISVDNEASKVVARRSGYVYEGTLRSLWFKQDLWEDGEIWSRIPDDPAPE
jgi:RimJ/RimL family protein N-acetyltransferase